ncbi:MAG: SpoIIE family protein phosphatase, partial [Christensenellales bacterium]
FMMSSQDTSKVLIGEQMGGVSKLLKSLIEDTSNNFNFDLSQEADIKEELKFLHILCTDVISFVKDGFYNITLIIKKTDYCKEDIEKVISKIVKSKMKICEISALNSQYDVLTIKNAPKFDCVFGVCGITKDNSEVSGDTYSFIKIDDDKILIALSDGMGSGEDAEHISEISLNLIENFYKAGFDNEIILNSVNKLLTINSEECFSALDICVIDLKKELIDFIKLGAPVGFVKKDNETTIIESGSLPIGILEEISPVVTKKVISGNEILILVSDGVIENFRGEENLKNFVNSLSSTNPQQICDEVINYCKQFEILDDCTCLALRIFEIVD